MAQMHHKSTYKVYIEMLHTYCTEQVTEVTGIRSWQHRTDDAGGAGQSINGQDDGAMMRVHEHDYMYWLVTSKTTLQVSLPLPSLLLYPLSLKNAD